VAGEDRPGPAPVDPRRLLPLVTVLLVTAVFVLTGPGNRSEADDAFWFAYDIEHGSIRELVGPDHAAHLAFLPLARGLFNLARDLGIEVRAYDVVRLANCLLAAVAVVLLHRLLRRSFRLSPFAAWAGAGGLAVSYGFWRYANETEVYAAAILVILLLCLVAFSGLRSTWIVVVAAVIASFAGLLHVLGVIPAVVVVPLVLLLERRWRDVAVYVAALVLVTGTVTTIAHRFAAPERSFSGYLLGQSPGTSYSPRAVPQSALTVGQNVASSNFLFAYRGIARRLAAAFPMQYLVEEQYAGERSDGVVRVVPLVTVPLLILLAASLLWSLRRRVPDRSSLPPGTGRLLAVVVAWIAAYWLVVVGRSSSAPEAWIPLLPALWIFIAVVLVERATTRASRSLVVALLVTLVVHNLAGGFWMMRSRSTDYNAVKAGWLLDHAHRGDVILTADGAVFERYLRYYSPADVVSLETLPTGELEALPAMQAQPGSRVFATESVFHPPAQIRAVDQARFEAIEHFGAAVMGDFRKVASSELGEVYLRQAE
jgi:glycerol-3-phosphate acyltransferase PlsY